MTCKGLFSRKNVISLSSAEFAQRVVKVYVLTCLVSTCHTCRCEEYLQQVFFYVEIIKQRSILVENSILCRALVIDI